MDTIQKTFQTFFQTTDKTFLPDIYSQIASTLVTAIIVMLIYFGVKFFIGRKIESDRIRERFKVRLFYIVTFVFVLLMAKIWFKGFTTIFTVIGVVIAAIVVTNKESIMNFTGWLIIQWRELFTEGDHIQVQNQSGLVQKIGIFHITLLESVGDSERAATGRIIRIPNSAVITNQVINYSQTSHFLAYNISFVVTGDSDLPLAMQLSAETIKKVLGEHYQNRPEYNKDYLARKNNNYFSLVNMEPYVALKPQQEKPFGIRLTVHYYCYARDHEAIDQKIWLTMLPMLQGHEKVRISYLT